MHDVGIPVQVLEEVDPKVEFVALRRGAEEALEGLAEARTRARQEGGDLGRQRRVQT